jgi:hypothetical protein
LVLAADRLAEQILEQEVQAQTDRSTATRQAAVKPAKQLDAANDRSEK